MLANGTLLQNRYLIKCPLAQGGMGTVYEAEAIHLGHTPVAVKETFFTQEWLREQFQREASMLARLRHDALPRVSDHFVEGAGQFLVMEFIPGQDLEELLSGKLKSEDSPFDWRQVTKWADRLLDALEYIHTQRTPIIHRDIKPSNLKLTPRGDLFLIDFGLAKDATTPTKPGRSVHAYTLNYAPPEQLKGTGTDARSDLYSLGATLHHLLCGEMPENAQVREEVIRYVVPDPLRPIHKINPQVPEPLAQVIARSMMLDRTERYQTAKAMREALRHALQTIEEKITKPGQQEAEQHQQKGKEGRRQRKAITRELQETEGRRQEEEERRFQEEARQRQLEEEHRRQQEIAKREQQEAERRKLEEEKRLREEEERLLAEQRRQEEEKRREEEDRQRELEEQRKQDEEKQRQEEQRIAEQKRLEQEQTEQRKRDEEKRRQEELRIAEQKRLELELAEQRKREEEEQRQEEQRIAEQKRLELELAEQRKQEEEKRREELNQREFERKRKKEIERRKRPGQVTKVQASKTSPKFKPSEKPPVTEKAPELPVIELLAAEKTPAPPVVKPTVTEVAPEVAKTGLLPNVELPSKTEPLPKQERKMDWFSPLRSSRVRLAAGAVTVLGLLLFIYSMWPHRESATALQPQPQASALPKVEVVETLRYWVQQFSKDQTSSYFVTKHELASGKPFKLHFEAREDGYLYLVARDSKTGQLKPLLPNANLPNAQIKSGSDFVFPPKEQGYFQSNDGKPLSVTVLLARNQIENFRDMLGQAKFQMDVIETLTVLFGAIGPSGTKDLSEGGASIVAVSGNAENRPLIFNIDLKFDGGN